MADDDRADNPILVEFPRYRPHNVLDGVGMRHPSPRALGQGLVDNVHKCFFSGHSQPHIDHSDSEQGHSHASQEPNRFHHRSSRRCGAPVPVDAVLVDGATGEAHDQDENEERHSMTPDEERMVLEWLHSSWQRDGANRKLERAILDRALRKDEPISPEVRDALADWFQDNLLMRHLIKGLPK